MSVSFVQACDNRSLLLLVAMLPWDDGGREPHDELRARGFSSDAIWRRVWERHVRNGLASVDGLTPSAIGWFDALPKD